jgi:hypothetical protein
LQWGRVGIACGCSFAGGGSLPPEPKPRLNRRGETPLQYDFYLKAFFIIPFIINAIDKIISSDKLSNLGALQIRYTPIASTDQNAQRLYPSMSLT